MNLKPIAVVSFSLSAGLQLAYGQATLSTVIKPSAPPAGKWVREKVTMATVDSAPKVDGVLDDHCWSKATRAVGFFRVVTSEPVSEQTEIWVCTDNKSLFIAFHCLESKPETIVAKETQRNGELGQDDKVAVLIDSQNAQRSVNEFLVSANGTQVHSLEGGSADNQAWQGDWTAAAKRVPTGYVVEMAIPLKMLRYPKGTKSFGMLFGRKKATETQFTAWPYTPPEAGTGSIAKYCVDFHGINPPAFAARPTVSPYMLGTTGQGSSLRFGLDAKVPLSTAYTGLLTVKPDFQTVEGAVQDLSFSYTEKYVPDRRPFFAEGGGFLDDSFLFYSQRIQDVDFGLKLTGKQGPTSVGFLATTAGVGTKQSAQVANFDHELGQYSGFGGTFLNSYQGGVSGQVGQIRGSYGWERGKRNYRFFGAVTQSSNTGLGEGSAAVLSFNSFGGQGALNVNGFWNSTSSAFANPLGLVGDVDVKGGGINLNSFREYDKGAIEEKVVYFGGNSFTHLDGSAFSKGVYLGTSIEFRNGYGLDGEVSVGQREAFHDKGAEVAIGWNRKSLLNRGRFSVNVGRRQNQASRYTSLNQGFALGKKTSLSVSIGEFRLGSDTQLQGIFSGTYRIDPLETIGGRLVMQGGNSNLYFSYGKRTRSGNDVFILLGDPNSPTTKRAITLKLVRSL
ncbi:MAG TPA: carbohydrate binding family 9 domain-containing protein [Fimbriimonas sp.]|nr:carbohydrate binding family 9 domain-containing protein [Fimbriimonas sp.]